MPPQNVSAFDPVVLPVGRDGAIVNYVVRSSSPDGPHEHTATSVWTRTHGGWRMVFHQGTAIPGR